MSALDFLLKPIRYNKFLAAIEKARKANVGSSVNPPQDSNTQTLTPNTQPPTPNTQHPTPNNSIFLRIDGELRQIQLSHLLYVSGMKDYVMFCMEDEKRPLITHLTMKAVEEMLPAEQFMRVNRSYIVALDKIRSVDRNDCIYIGNEVIRVTEAYREAFLEYVNSKFPGA